MDFNLGEYFPEKDSLNKPSDLELIYYIFWDKGISQNDINNMDLPYIFSIIRSFKYIKDKEQKEIENAKRH